MRRTIEVGDTVVYTPAWLHSTGQAHTDIAHYRGTVQSVTVHSESLVLAKVAWTLDGTPVMDADGTPWIPAVNVLNIARPMTARSVDVPVWVGCGKVTSYAREGIESERASRREMDARILREYQMDETEPCPTTLVPKV